MSSNIPAARSELHLALLTAKSVEEMRFHVIEALKMMTRERHKPVTARAKLPSLTPALADQIRLHVRQHPSMSTLDVASHFGVNPGRVSEAIAGWYA